MLIALTFCVRLLDLAKFSKGCKCSVNTFVLYTRESVVRSILPMISIIVALDQTKMNLLILLKTCTYKHYIINK